MSTYTPLRIATIKSEREISFSLYIYFKDQFLEYLKPGNSFTIDKYKKLKKQKITKFYILDSDEKKYQSFLDNILEQTLNSSEASTDEKVEIVEAQTQTALERLQKDPTSEESFNMTRKASKNLQNLVFNNPEALEKFFVDGESAGSLVKHSLNVCVLSIKLAQKLKCKDDDIDNLSTAALMHDIGLTQIEKETQALFNTNKSELTPAQKLEFNKHCSAGTSILEGRDYINKDIISLIENHEEVLSGTGPNKKSKLILVEEILSMVNCYDKKLVSEKLTPAEAIKSMMIEEVGKYDLKNLQELKSLLKEEKIT